MNERAVDFLIQAQNSDGGWGYRAGGMSFVEPTAAVVLALGESDARTHARDFLLRLQQSDGGWGIAAQDSESGWMTAWAVLSLAQIHAPEAAVDRGVAWLLATSPLYITDETPRQDVLRVFKIDSALRGFPWQSGDASWVHPTSLALRALAATGRRAESRAQEAVEYLFDRLVMTGGWNVGNPWMIDKKLPATIQDTAIALVALHDAKADNDSRVDVSIQFLRDALSGARAPADLAWGIYALHSWKSVVSGVEVEVRDLTARLYGLQNVDGDWRGNPFITAMALQATR